MKGFENKFKLKFHKKADLKKGNSYMVHKIVGGSLNSNKVKKSVFST